MKTVELHIAFLFICETCGRDNFARAVVLEPELVREMAGPEGAAELDDLVDGDVTGTFCTAPERVTCQWCGEEYETEES